MKILFPHNIPIEWNKKHQDLEYVSNNGTAWKGPEDFNAPNIKMGAHKVEEPYEWMRCVTDVIDTLPIKNVLYAFNHFEPNSFLPMHSDLYGYYAKTYNIKDLNNIVRLIIFLDDGEPGQLLIIENNCIMNYNKGDVAYWYGRTPHLAANLCDVDRYTLQITGTLE